MARKYSSITEPAPNSGLSTISFEKSYKYPQSLAITMHESGRPGSHTIVLNYNQTLDLCSRLSHYLTTLDGAVRGGKMTGEII